MPLHPNLGVVVHRLRGGEQNQRRLRAAYFVGEFDQPPPNAPVLVGFVHGQVGEVAAKGKIAQGAAHPHQFGAVPGRDEYVGLVEHPLDALLVVHGAALAEGRAVEHVDKLTGRNEAVGGEE